MKRYSDNPLKVRLHHIQEDALNEMMTNTSYCMSKGIYSKSDVVRNSINNVLKDYQKTTLGTR
jgi:hypothetical protein